MTDFEKNSCEETKNPFQKWRLIKRVKDRD
jgi:hypothetical protein